MLLVLDTDVVVAAMRSPTGASAEVLRLVRSGRLRMACSVSLFMEYETVCSRAAHLEAANWTQDDLAVFLNAIASWIEPVKIHYLWRPQLRDPADEMVLEAAVNAQAYALLTFNTRHFLPAIKQFNVKLLTPSQFLGAHYE